jgi:hypothetical protein
VAGIGWVVLGVLVEEGVGQYVRRHWPSFVHWWSSRGGLYMRFSILLLFFAASAVFFGLLTTGVVGGHRPDAAGLALTLPCAAMALVFLVSLLRLRSTGTSRRGYRRSSDGTWSAD